MCDGRRRREREEEAADGMQNQKQKPHTKMWGKNDAESETTIFISFLQCEALSPIRVW